LQLAFDGTSVGNTGDSSAAGRPDGEARQQYGQHFWILVGRIGRQAIQLAVRARQRAVGAGYGASEWD